MVPMFAGSSQLTSEFLTVAESGGGDQILHVQFSPNGNWHIICSVRGTWIHSVDKSVCTMCTLLCMPLNNKHRENSNECTDYRRPGCNLIPKIYYAPGRVGVTRLR